MQLLSDAKATHSYYDGKINIATYYFGRMNIETFCFIRMNIETLFSLWLNDHWFYFGGMNIGTFFEKETSLLVELNALFFDASDYVGAK